MLNATAVILRGLLFTGMLATVACGAPRNGEIGLAQEKEKPEPGWLGVSISNVPKQAMEKYKLGEDGAYVNNVVDDSPADKAGLKKADVITKFGQRTIYDADDLAKAVKRTAPGTSVPVSVYREGKKKDLTVTIDERPVRKRRAVTWVGRGPRMMFFSSSFVEGMNLTELNEQLAEYFGAPNKEGVLVQEVEEGSAADKAGFKAGDVILKVGNRDVDEIRDISRELDEYDKGEKVQFEVLRKGSAKSLTLQMEEDEDEWGFRVFPSDESGIHIRHLSPSVESEIEIDHLEKKLHDLQIRMEDAERNVRQRILRITPEINGVRARVFSIISV